MSLLLAAVCSRLCPVATTSPFFLLGLFVLLPCAGMLVAAWNGYCFAAEASSLLARSVFVPTNKEFELTLKGRGTPQLEYQRSRIVPIHRRGTSGTHTLNL